jgi:1-acyl-sn-glycerol-3-phosphate acyltransferase
MFRLRAILYVVVMTVAVAPWSFVVLASWVTPPTTRYKLCVMWTRLAIYMAKWICGVTWRVEGWENLPDGPTIVLPKHQSTWETFALPTLMPHPLAYVFKRELLLIPFFGWAMSRLDMIHIDRSKRAEAWAKVAAQGQRLMSEGVWVILFPEGTRTPRGSQGTYKSGAARLAVTTGTPIVPIAVTSARCWPRKSFLLRPGVIDVSIGPPIPSLSREPDELMREVEAWIEAEMRRLDPEAYPSGAGGEATRGVNRP